MHSRIFLVSMDTKKDLPLECEDSIYESEMPWTDYVTNSDLTKDVKNNWLDDLELVEEKGTNEDGETITVYTIADFNEFVKKAFETTIKQTQKAFKTFMEHPNILAAYQLADAVNTKTGRHFILYNADGSYEDHFINSFSFAYFLKKEGAQHTFYIYQSFDYHF